MDFSIFIIEMIQAIKDKLGPEFNVTSRKVLKNNSVVFEGIMIKKGNSEVVPSIYLESFYQSYLSGTPLEEVVDQLYDFYLESIENKINAEQFNTRFDNPEERVFFRLVNFEKNLTLLKDSTYVKVNDLAAIVYYCVSVDSSGISSVRLTKKFCETNGYDKNELCKMAYINTEKLFPAVFKSMEDILGKLKGVEEEQQNHFAETLNDDGTMSQMYVLTNSSGLNGATCLLYKGILDRCYEKLGPDFYILPCSIHEVILVPASACESYESLENMVRSVNRSEVDTLDYLSDRVYHYPFDLFEIEIE